LVIVVSEDLLDPHRVFNAGDNLDGAAAFAAGLDADAEKRA